MLAKCEIGVIYKSEEYGDEEIMLCTNIDLVGNRGEQ